MKRRSLMKGLFGLPALSSMFSKGLKAAPEHVALPSKMVKGSADDCEANLNVVSGKYPGDLHGHAYFLEGMSDGDGAFVKTGHGAVNRVSFGAEGANWKRKLIKTPSMLMAQALAGTSHAFKLQAKSLYKSPTLGYMNTSNTSAVALHDGRMAFTFEGGCHWEFDPDSLALKTPIGRPDEWRSGVPEMFDPNPFFKQVRTTAHPYFDEETQEFLTLNYGSKVKIFGTSLGEAFTNIVRFKGQGDLEVFEVVDIATGKPVAIENNSHSFLVTRNHIGIVETPAVFEPEKVLGLPGDHTRKMPNATKIWWVKRQDLSGSASQVKARLSIIPKPCIDLLANYNDVDDVITVFSGSIQSFDVTEFLEEGNELLNGGGRVREDLLGYAAAPSDRGGFVKCLIEVGSHSAKVLESTFREEPLAWGIEFPAYLGNYKSPETFEVVYWSTNGFHHDGALQRLADLYRNAEGRSLKIEDLPKESQSPAILAVDCTDVNVFDAYALPAGHVLTSIQFVPRKGGASQKDGYLACFVHHDQVRDSSLSTGQEIWLFDAKDLGQGPVCRLGHSSMNVGSTLHSTWMKDIRASKADDYKVDLGQAYEGQLKGRPKEVEQAWRKVLAKFV